jgi:hypothetical protein
MAVINADGCIEVEGQAAQASRRTPQHARSDDPSHNDCCDGSSPHSPIDLLSAGPENSAPALSTRIAKRRADRIPS